MEENDYMKCICCNKQKEALVAVMLKKDSIFINRRGVCQDCIKVKDINKVCTEFEIRKTEDSVKQMKDGLKAMEEHLEKLR